jgi:hypothetical protein
MSIQFSNTTTKRGLIQLCERYCGFNDGDISGNTTLLAQFTADLNNALDDTYSTIFKAGGTWQFDDSNHTTYPIMTTDLVAGQRDYTFTADGGGNLVLDIYKVTVKDEYGIYHEIYPVDQQSPDTNAVNVDSFIDGIEKQGKIDRYDKTANGIFLDKVPAYNATDGLKVYINREGSYFTTSDTTKKPGFAGLFHEYLSLVVAYKYARTHDIKNIDRLERDMLLMEQKIGDYYGRRERDIIRRLTPNRENNR